MPTDFDWQAEDKSVWGEPETPPEPEESGQFRWLPMLLVFLVLSVVGGIVYQQLSQRTEETVDTVKEEVIASYALLRFTAERGDQELFASFLSGRQERWTDAQIGLLRQRLLFPRHPLGLQWQATNLARDRIGVTLSPDLMAAEIRAPEQYAFDAGGGVTETVTLQHTAVFRRGQQRWLLSPPEADFWGEWASRQGQRLTVAYPQRDAAIAQRLAADLEGKLAQLCSGLLALTCADDLQIRLRLETDPDSLLLAADEPRMLLSGRNLVLPAPTLVGLPVDEAGYRALFRGYATHVVSATITELVGWQGEHALFFKALLDTQLQQLDLQPWPLTAADYERLLDRPFSLEQLNPFWDQSLKAARSEPNWGQVYAFIDFLWQRSTAETATSLQRSLIATDSYWNWVSQFINTPVDDSVTASSMEQLWVGFAYQQSLSGQSQAPIPLPQQAIRLWCDANPGRGETIHHYDLATGTWSTDPRLVENDYSLIEALPDGKGLLVESFLFVDAEPRWRALLLQNGQSIRLAEWRSADAPLESTGRIDPSGQKLVTVEGRQTKAYRLLDLNQCQSATCSLQPLSGLPVWSPQGSRSIVMVDETSLTGGAATGQALFRGDDQGQLVKEIGTGYAPFWLDEERYGYVRFDGERNEVVTAVAGEDEPRVVLTLEGLLSQLPEAADLGQAFISRVVVNPQDSGLWLIRVSGASSQQIMVLIEPGQGEAAVTQVPLPQSDIMLPGARFSPDGRWLTVNAVDSDTSLRTLHLYDLEGQRRRSLSTDNPYAFVGHDWSADGQWLLFVGDGHLKLVAVDYDYQQLILYPFPRCSDAALVDLGNKGAAGPNQ